MNTPTKSPLSRLEQLESIDNRLLQLLNILESIREDVVDRSNLNEIHSLPIQQNFALSHIHVISGIVGLYKANYSWSAAEIRRGIPLENVKDIEHNDFERINQLIKQLVDKWMV